MTTRSEPPILSAEDIAFSYGPLQVLFGISLELHRGEALALLGTNGAGKSTLLKVIAGLAKCSTGRVQFDGRDVTGVPAEHLARRGLVLLRGGQGVFKDMTVAENLDVHRFSLPHDKDHTERQRALIFDAFPPLRDRLRQKAGLLSGGEQQQLVLAKAIMLDPAVLCIDELSLGLAPIVVQQLLSIVRVMHDGGTSIILVEQSLNIASKVCERAIFLEKGQVRFEGRTKELLERDDIARAVFLGA